MKRFKKTLRLLGLIFLIVMASCGVGIIGTMFTSRERYADREIRIELTEKKEDEEEADDFTARK
jgi:flagellar basal body-associated protein FliL